MNIRVSKPPPRQPDQSFESNRNFKRLYWMNLSVLILGFSGCLGTYYLNLKFITALSIQIALGSFVVMAIWGIVFIQLLQKKWVVEIQLIHDHFLLKYLKGKPVMSVDDLHQVDFLVELTKVQVGLRKRLAVRLFNYPENKEYFLIAHPNLWSSEEINEVFMAFKKRGFSQCNQRVVQ
jgi:hypothetical protein